MDLAVPSLAIAHFFGRLGCFSAGCCFGKPAPGLPWAVVFSDPLSLAPVGIPLHPTQLYDALNALIIFAITFSLRHKKKFYGQLLLIYMMLYSIGRSIVEIYQGRLDSRFRYRRNPQHEPIYFYLRFCRRELPLDLLVEEISD